MSDLISRQTAIDYLMVNMNWYDEDGYESEEDYKRECITDLINGVPSAQPERKPGKWDSNRCSECGFGVLLSPYMHNLDTGEYTLLYKYCPNCGAKMEGEDDG